MSITSWVDERIATAITEALTPENLTKLAGVLGPMITEAVKAETAAIIGQVESSAATVINEVGSRVDRSAQNITNDVNSIGTTVTNNANAIIQGVISGIKSLLPFPF